MDEVRIIARREAARLRQQARREIIGQAERQSQTQANAAYRPNRRRQSRQQLPREQLDRVLEQDAEQYRVQNYM